MSILLKIKTIACVVLLCVATNSFAANKLKRDSLTLAFKKGVMIKVPRQALAYQNGVPGVFVIQNNEARFRMVRLGRKVKKSVYILAGLFGNETLILSNVSTLFDGKPLN